MEQELMIRESTEIELGTLRANTPAALLAAASSIATPLAEMIDKQGLAINIQGRSYVRCEGWVTMGAMLGVTPQEVSNTQDGAGVYVATVELVNIRTGAVVGRASAECGAPDELDKQGNPFWSNRPQYARRSMAATRATSKAFRQSFSWIMVMAGYQPTPAEEVPDGGFIEAPKQTNEAPSFATFSPGTPRSAAPSSSSDFEIPFGQSKGTMMSKASNGDLKFLLSYFEKAAMDPKKARFRLDNEAKLKACLNEYQRRHENATQGAGDIPF